MLAPVAAAAAAAAAEGWEGIEGALLKFGGREEKNPRLCHCCGAWWGGGGWRGGTG
jgi:hypothetical protein